MCILEPSPYMGLSDVDRHKAITYDCWKEDEFYNLDSVYNIPEFEPYVDMVREYLDSQPDGSFTVSSRETVLIRFASIYWQENSLGNIIFGILNSE